MIHKEKGEKRGLTKRYKRSIIYGDGSFFSLRFLGQLRRFKVKTASALSSLSTFLFKPHKGWKDVIMKMTLRSFGGKNSVQALAIAALLATIAGCGGGGSSNGGGTTPPPPAVPTATVASLAPASGATGVAVDGKVVIGLNVTNATGGDASKLIYSCNNKAVGFVATTTVAAGVSTSTLVTTGLNNSVTCTVSGNVATTGAGGTVQTPVNMSFTVVAVTPWWPPVFVPQGTKVYLDSAKVTPGAVANATYPGQGQSGLLPAECKKVGDACWQEATRNGTIKYIATGGVGPEIPAKPIVFAFYKVVSTILFPGQNKVLYCNRPVFAADGSYGAADFVENRCNQSEEVFFVGNSLGGIGLYIENGTNVYYQKKYDSSLGGWAESPTTYP